MRARTGRWQGPLVESPTGRELIADRATATRVGVAGAMLMAVTFGMARYAYGLTLPDIRAGFAIPELVLGLIASGTFLGFLLALILSTPLATRWGPRAPTTLGGGCAAAGCALVAVAPTPTVLAVGALVAGSAAGWVRAPYSEIVTAVASARDRPRLLVWITTGAAGGLVVVGALALAVASWAGWRWTWAGIAVVAAAATAVNIRWVPRLAPAPRASRPGRRDVPVRAMAQPLGFAVVLFVGATAYLTYAGDAAGRGGLGAAAGPTVFLLAGVTGLGALGTGDLARRAGPAPVAGGALLTMGAALTMLGVGSSSLPVVLVSAVLFGAANTVGSAALSIWTAQVAPGRPGAAFAVALVVGSLGAIATPAIIGSLVPHTGLSVPLVAIAGISAVGAVVLVAVRTAGWARRR